MKSSLKMLSAIMFGIMNVMDATTDATNIKLFYDGLLNNGGADISKLDNWMNNFADTMKYCDYSHGVPQCMDKDGLKPIIQTKYFGTNNLIKQQCNIGGKYGEGSIDIDCKFTFKNTNDGCTTEMLASEHIDYDPNGEKVLQYYLMASKIISNKCAVDNKIQLFYDGLLNNAEADISKLDNWMNNFADTMKYCDYTQGVPKCTDKDGLKLSVRKKYFDIGRTNLINHDCNINKKNDGKSVDIECEFSFKSLPQGLASAICTKKVSAKEYIDYDPNGDKILQYYTLSWKTTHRNCEIPGQRRLAHQHTPPPQYAPPPQYTPGQRRLAHQLTPAPTTSTYTTTTSWTKSPSKTPVDTCYNTVDKNPCTRENIEAEHFYFKSCNSCCYFIQCDESGHAFDRPCAPGTFWDQKLLTCNHNMGQCQDNKCPKPTPKPTPAPTKSTATKSPTKTPCSTCYNTMDKNPCTGKNIAAGKFYFPSCHSCCNFIQCDAFGKAFDMPCAPGTFWDQSVLTCNHNNGECKDDKCLKRTPIPTKVWTKPPTTRKPTPAPTNKAWWTKAPSTTKSPTKSPTTTKSPTKWPTKAPTTTEAPTKSPTTTQSPTKWPTKSPTTTEAPTNSPTTTEAPTEWPTKSPTTTEAPTKSPTKVPTNAPTTTKSPTKWPTKAPTTTEAPTNVPTTTEAPTKWPTKSPTTTKSPSKVPTNAPTTTKSPTKSPTKTPTKPPTTTAAPTKTPTKTPTKSPTTTEAPTKSPTTTKSPTNWPTKAPTTTEAPTKSPTTTKSPTKWPTKAPTTTEAPTKSPTKSPTKWWTKSSTTTESPTKSPTTTKAPTPCVTKRPKKKNVVGHVEEDKMSNYKCENLASRILFNNL